MNPKTPLVKKFFLKIPPPSLKDNTAEIDRLKRQIRNETGIESLTLPFAQIPSWTSVLREAGYQVTATVAMTPPLYSIIHLESGDTTRRNFGLAVDLGTTRMAFQLWDLAQGKLLAETSSENPQTRFGADILTRIHLAESPANLRELQTCVIAEINRILDQFGKECLVSPQEVLALALAGNTTMTHLFLGLNPASICREPYIPILNTIEPLTAQDLGLNLHPRAVIYVLPQCGQLSRGGCLGRDPEFQTPSTESPFYPGGCGD